MERLLRLQADITMTETNGVVPDLRLASFTARPESQFAFSCAATALSS